jgi:hypothetical protein
MKEKLTRMYLGICSSTAVNRYRSFKYSTECRFYYSLNIRNPRLSLPAIILQAVIAYMYKVSQFYLLARLFNSSTGIVIIRPIASLPR